MLSAAAGINAVTIVGGCVEIETAADVAVSTVTAGFETPGKSVAVATDWTGGRVKTPTHKVSKGWKNSMQPCVKLACPIVGRGHCMRWWKTASY